MYGTKIKWTSAASVVICLASAGPAFAQTTVKIGIVNSYSGFLAGAGDQMQKGMDLYAKTRMQELPAGVGIEILKRDDGTNPETGKRVAQELVTRDKVQILLGVVGSPIAAAIAPLATEAKVPFIITNAGGAGIPRISPYVARVSFTLWQTGLPLGKWAAGQGWKKGYTMVSDFIPGHDGEAAFTKGFTDNGGQMAGAIRFPANNPDFAPFVQKAKDAKPEVLFVFVPGGPQ
jgi:branched-chain amino acid transport system substrate-binding protein